MSQDFDAYYTWLAIPPEDQPPDLYRLLGVKRLEGNSDVIEHAADQRMAHLRGFQAGKHADESQRLLNEISKARICLLNPDKKAAYDAQLRAGELERQRRVYEKPLPLAQPLPITRPVPLDQPLQSPKPLDAPRVPVSESEKPQLASAMVFSGLTQGGRPLSSAVKARPVWQQPLVMAGAGTAMLLVLAAVVALAMLGGSSPSNSQPLVDKSDARITPSPQAEIPIDQQPSSVQTAVKPESPEQPAAVAVTADAGTESLPVTHGGASRPAIAVPLNESPGVVGDPANPPTSVAQSADSNAPAAESNSPRSLARFLEPLPAAAPDKQPIPDAATQQTAREEVKRILKDDYGSAKSPQELATLARKLRGLAEGTNDDPVVRYVLFDEALRTAVAGGQLVLALPIIEELAGEYEADVWALKAAAIRDVAPAARTPLDRKQLAQTTLDVVSGALAERRFDVAETLITLAEANAARAGDAVLRGDIRQRSQEIDELRKRWDLAKLAAERLQAEPDNAKANLALGRFVCFVERKWDEGLAYLVKGDDEKLAKLAQQDLDRPDGTNEQIAVADAWSDVAQSAGTLDKNSMLARAHNWYRQAAQGAVGLDKVRVEKRTKEIEQEIPAANLDRSLLAGGTRRSINLIPLIDPARDRVHGTWRIVDDTLVCDTSELLPRIQIPYQPPEEYDFKIVFSQPAIRRVVGIVLPKNGASFTWRVGGSTGYFGFSVRTSDGTPNLTEKRGPASVQPNRMYTTLVQVRNDGVKAFFEGQLVAAYQTDYRDMQADSKYTLPDKSLPAVSCDDPTVFHVVEITEVTGSGRRRR